MDDTEEADRALISAAFAEAARSGWHRVSVARAARLAGVPLGTARARFPARIAVLLRFGRLLDQAALADAPAEGPVRERVFDLLMRRFDALQQQRAGVRALLRALPFDPPLAVALAALTRRSMAWILEAAGGSAQGPRGAVRVRALLGVWVWGLRAWERDASADLSSTMAAVDRALMRIDRILERPDRRSGREPAPFPGETGRAASEDSDTGDGSRLMVPDQSNPPPPPPPAEPPASPPPAF